MRGNSLIEEFFKVLLGRGVDLACRKLFLGQFPIAEKEADAVAVEGEQADYMQVATIDRSRRQIREIDQLVYVCEQKLHYEWEKRAEGITM